MKNFWKWILGIVIVLVVLFGLGVGGRLLMRSVYSNTAIDVDEFTSPMMVRVDGPGDGVIVRQPMIVGSGGISAYGGMIHHSRGFMRLGWLVPLALLGLVIYGAYRLGTRKSQVAAASAAPVAQAPVHTCTKCGQLVQDGWSHCAHCGRKL